MDVIELSTDVLIVGGGLAGVNAAMGASEKGAGVLLADEVQGLREKALDQPKRAAAALRRAVALRETITGFSQPERRGKRQMVQTWWR